MTDALQNYSDSLRSGTQNLVGELTKKQKRQEKSMAAFEGLAEPIAVDTGEDLVKEGVKATKKYLNKKAGELGESVKHTLNNTINKGKQKFADVVANPISTKIKTKQPRTKTQGSRKSTIPEDDEEDLKTKIANLLPSEENMKQLRTKMANAMLLKLKAMRDINLAKLEKEVIA